MRKFSQIFGCHVFFIFLSFLLLIFLTASVTSSFDFSSYCTAQSPDSETVEGRVAAISRRSTGGRSSVLVYKIEYKDRQGYKQVFYTGKDSFRNKKVGDSLTLKVNNGKIIVPDCSDVVLFLVSSVFTLLLFSGSAVAGLLLRNYQNEVYKGKEAVILLVTRLLMLCASFLAFYSAVVWMRDDFLPKEVESAQILSINLGKQGCVLTVKTLDGREESLTTLTLPPIPILSTGQNVEVLFPKDGKPRLPTKETSVVFFAGSFYLLFVSVSAFFRRRKSYKISVSPEDNVELPPFDPFKG